VTTNKLAGADAARHGTGDADLTVMLAAHEALRRDLTGLAHAAAATGSGRGDPGRRQAVQRGWAVFQRQLHIHHTAEDELVWPALRDRLAASDAARSVLDAMEAEHEQIDPLLAAVNQAMDGADRDGQPDGAALADTVDVLTMALHGHLAHEERDALPLIGTALTVGEWRAVGRRIGLRNLRRAPEMFAWMLDGAAPERAAAATGQLPPPARVLYRAVWQPRFARRERW